MKWHFERQFKKDIRSCYQQKEGVKWTWTTVFMDRVLENILSFLTSERHILTPWWLTLGINSIHEDIVQQYLLKCVWANLSFSCGWCPLFFFFSSFDFPFFSPWLLYSETLSSLPMPFYPVTLLFPAVANCVQLSRNSGFCSLTCQLTFPTWYLTPSPLLWPPWSPRLPLPYHLRHWCLIGYDLSLGGGFAFSVEHSGGWSMRLKKTALHFWTFLFFSVPILF